MIFRFLAFSILFVAAPYTANAANAAKVFCFLSVANNVLHNGPCTLRRAIDDQPIGVAAAFTSSHRDEVQILTYDATHAGIKIEKGSNESMQLLGIGEKHDNCFVSISAVFCYYKTSAEFTESKRPPPIDPPVDLSIPDFPVDKGCAQYGRSIQGYSYAERLCLTKEQESYNQTKEVWENVPREIQEACFDQAGMNFLNIQYLSPLGFPYVTLLECIGADMRKREAAQGFQK